MVSHSKMTDSLSNLNITPLRTYTRIFKERRGKKQFHICSGMRTHLTVQHTHLDSTQKLDIDLF